MATKSELKLSWVTVDPATLPKALAALYAKRQALMAEVRKVDAEFNPGFTKALVAGEHVDEKANVKLSHNFGKLSFAIAPTEEPKAQTGKFKFGK